MGRTASNVTIALSMAVSFAWLLMITIPVSWHRKSTLIWSFEVGLYHVEVQKALLGHTAYFGAWAFDSAKGKVTGDPSNGAQQVMDMILEGEQSLRYYRDAFCSAGTYIGDNCTPWDHLLIGSWVLMICATITILMFLTASGFQWYYWTQESRRHGRHWAQGLYISAPIVIIFGMIAYSLLTISFGRWLSEMAISSSRATFSHSYVFACMLCLFSFIPSLIMCTFGGYHDMEETHEAISRQRKEMMQEAYGGCDEMYGKADFGGYDQQGNPRPYGQPDPYSQPDPYGQPQGYRQSQQYAGAAYSQPYGQQQYTNVTVTTHRYTQQYPSGPSPYQQQQY